MTQETWAKLERDEHDTVTAALPLLDHLLDVAATMAAILRHGAWARALAETAGRALTDLDIARLIVLAAIHDIGKANWGFQARIDPRADRVGHEGQVQALLVDPALQKTGGAQALLALIRGWAAGPYIAAVMAHHGRPRAEYRHPQHRPANILVPHVQHWRPKGGYDPAAEVARLLDALRARFPEAWADGATLPDSPRFVSLFAGLLVLADWIGSDTARFPVAGPHGDAREPLRRDAAAAAVVARGLAPLAVQPAAFAAAFGHDAPRGVQREAAADDLGPVALIEAETGSGKTEAALWRWLDLRRRGEVDGLYFALPTRAAAIQLQRRVDDMLTRVWDDNAPRAVLAVPGYLRAGDTDGQRLPGFEVRWDDDRGDARWAAEHANRYLAARVAVGTIDQALRAALCARHAPFRAAMLSRSLLVVDEVHASDAYMSGLLARLLDNHVAAGGRALLLSATLGAAARARFLRQPLPSLAEAEAAPYPALSGTTAAPRAAPATGTSKTVVIETAGIIADPEAIAARAVAAARAGASVLVIRNTVTDAIATAQAVEALAPDLAFKVAGTGTLHHGRFAPDDRRRLDHAVEEAFGKKRTALGRILVGTQTLEQSLDLDADLLLTDLAPMDVLLQRIGRLHRHERDDRGAFAQARAIVLRPAERDLSPLLVRPQHGLGPAKHGGPYPDLLQVEATLRLLEKTPVATIPEDNRRLVERALHPESVAEIVAGADIAWRNHDAARRTAIYGEGQAADTLSLDLAQSFRDMVFRREDEVATRLGDQALLVDFARPLDGPFGESVHRMAIPYWMAGADGLAGEPEFLGSDEEDALFRLGARRFAYSRWGLRLVA